MKAATTAFTFKTLLRHYAQRAFTPRSLNVKLGPRHNYHKGQAALVGAFSVITNLSSSNHHHHHLYVGFQHDAAEAVARDVHRPAQPRLGRLVLAVVQSTGDLQGVGEVADPGLKLRV